MLKKKYRLKQGTRFKNASVLDTSFYKILITENGLNINRYSFIVSKKVDKRAVIRNKTRRKVRACIEKMLEGIKKGHDMLFFIKKEAVQEDMENICGSIENTFRKANLLVE
ncbi:MAG: ribonuclease P protein component [Patescibacteria group bacterium]|nr:ribonuclease P protein component [Patescibacteria group bacterium]